MGYRCWSRWVWWCCCPDNGAAATGTGRPACSPVVGSELCTQLLKAVLPRPGAAGPNTLPSGHVTIVAAFVLASVAVARRRRGVAALGALVVAGVAAGTLMIGWHRPAGTVAALGVVTVCWGDPAGRTCPPARCRGR